MQTVAPVDLTTLSPFNPSVRAIALRARWRPETLVRDVRKHLPATVEQQMYLRVAESVRIRPETLAKILRVLLGPRQLRPHDMIDVPVGKNLSVNLFVQTLDLALETLAVTHVLAEEYRPLSAVHAARLVKAYGPENVQDIVDSLICYVANVMDLGEKKRAMAILWFAREGLTFCENGGYAYPNDVGPWLEQCPEAKRSLHRYIGWPR